MRLIRASRSLSKVTPLNSQSARVVTPAAPFSLGPHLPVPISLSLASQQSLRALQRKHRGPGEGRDRAEEGPPLILSPHPPAPLSVKATPLWHLGARGW